jgi:hypothetical protein
MLSPTTATTHQNNTNTLQGSAFRFTYLKIKSNATPKDNFGEMDVRGVLIYCAD